MTYLSCGDCGGDGVAVGLEIAVAVAVFIFFFDIIVFSVFFNWIFISIHIKKENKFQFF